MAASNFTTTLVVDKSAKEAFDAINNVRGWWQGELEGNTDKLNEEFVYRMEDIHFSKQKITTLVPNEKVVWLITDSNLSFTKDKSEWTGTEVIFEISETDNKTQIRFTHSGLTSQFECYDACSNAWGLLVQESLRSLITTGKGVEVF